MKLTATIKSTQRITAALRVTVINSGGSVTLPTWTGGSY